MMDHQIRQKIQTILDQHRNMTIATLRPDGWPQATTVGYVNEGLAPEDVALFRVVPEIVSVLDYTQGFAHTDLVSC